MLQVLGFRVHGGLGFRVQALGFRVLVFRVLGFASSFGFRAFQG